MNQIMGKEPQKNEEVSRNELEIKEIEFKIEPIF